jgi:hypothetical protein
MSPPKVSLKMPGSIGAFLDAAAEAIVVADEAIRVGNRLKHAAKTASDNIAKSRPRAAFSFGGFELDLGGDAGGEGASAPAVAPRRGTISRTGKKAKGGAKRAHAAAADPAAAGGDTKPRPKPATKSKPTPKKG